MHFIQFQITAFSKHDLHNSHVYKTQNTSDFFKYWYISEAYSVTPKMSLPLSMSCISGVVSFVHSKSSSSLESITMGESTAVK